MQLWFLSIVTLAFASVSAGHRYMQSVKPQYQETIARGQYASATPTNGSTLEDIMRELDLRYYTTICTALCEHVVYTKG